METTDMETTVAETKDSETTDTDQYQQTSPKDQHAQSGSQDSSQDGSQDDNQDNHSAGNAANDTPDKATDGNSDDNSDHKSDDTINDQQPPASLQQLTNQHLTNRQEADKDQAKNDEVKKDQSGKDESKEGEARKDQAKKDQARKVGGLSLSPAANGQKTARPSLQNRLAQQQASTRSSSRKKKLIRISVVTVAVLAIGIYFYHQIQSLVRERTTGVRTPGRPVRLDSTAWKIDPLSTSYEKEAKNRYQDSLNRAIKQDAMGHIVMDWGRLYNVNNYDPDRKRQNSQASKDTDSNTATVSAGEKSLYDLLSKELSAGQMGNQPGNRQADSLALEQKRLAAIQASNRQASKGAPASGSIATGTARKGSSARTSTRNRVQPDNALAQSTTRQPAENSLFNVIHGSSSTGSSSSVDTRGSNGNSGNGNHSSGNYSSGNRSETVTDAGAEPVVVRAVVHGNHKITSGSKVAFRLLEGVSFQGVRFEKNTILIGIATFRNGRVNFSDFRSKSLSSVSASHGAVASTALPMVCYDTDMVAGISVSDQSPVETQTRQAGTSALSDAANDVSYSIPYGSLARAASSLTRGVASGKRQQREKFIDLADNYPVLLELMPPKAK